jgi:hypothetical protein
MTSEANSNSAPSASGSAKKEPQYRMDPAQIPQDLRQTVAAKMSPEADVYPAKDGGNYKGRIVHADERFIVQASRPRAFRRGNQGRLALEPGGQ